LGNYDKVLPEKRTLKEGDGKMISWLMLIISSGCFVGFIPGWITGTPGKGGGTAGAILALAIQFGILLRLDNAMTLSFGLVIVTFLAGIVSIQAGERFMFIRWGAGRRHTGEVVQHDRNETCIDEIHGQFLAAISIFYIPATSTTARCFGLLLAFALFRILDGCKPWPIRNVEKQLGPSALGIMLDDTLAAVIAAILCLLYVKVV
jgi:phosphatidylglycerophosphatase A